METPLEFVVGDAFADEPLDEQVREYLIEPFRKSRMVAGVVGNIRTFSAHRLNHREVMGHSGYAPVTEEVALILIYLLILFPRHGNSLLSFRLNRKLDYCIYVNKRKERASWELWFTYTKEFGWMIKYGRMRQRTILNGRQVLTFISQESRPIVMKPKKGNATSP